MSGRLPEGMSRGFRDEDEVGPAMSDLSNEARARHREGHIGNDVEGFCLGCGQPWPCEVTRLAGRVEEDKAMLTKFAELWIDYYGPAKSGSGMGASDEKANLAYDLTELADMMLGVEDHNPADFSYRSQPHYKCLQYIRNDGGTADLLSRC